MSIRQYVPSACNASPGRKPPNDQDDAMNDTMIATIRVNGESETLAVATVAALLDEKEIAADARGVEVALNGSVVPRAAWRETPLRPGDAVELVRARQGGCPILEPS